MSSFPLELLFFGATAHEEMSIYSWAKLTTQADVKAPLRRMQLMFASWAVTSASLLSMSRCRSPPPNQSIWISSTTGKRKNVLLFFFFYILGWTVPLKGYIWWYSVFFILFSHPLKWLNPQLIDPTDKAFCVAGYVLSSAPESSVVAHNY